MLLNINIKNIKLIKGGIFLRFIPNVPPTAFSFSAVIIGYLLIDDTTANEQNALGNWLMLVAQVLCTNAYYAQVQAERGNLNMGARTPQSGKSNNPPTNEETLEMLNKMVNALNKEIEEIKKELNK